MIGQAVPWLAWYSVVSGKLSAWMPVVRVWLNATPAIMLALIMAPRASRSFGSSYALLIKRRMSCIAPIASISHMGWLSLFQYASIAWQNASMPVEAVTAGGSE